jgi:hypothetical protein
MQEQRFDPCDPASRCSHLNFLPTVRGKAVLNGRTQWRIPKADSIVRVDDAADTKFRLVFRSHARRSAAFWRSKLMCGHFGRLAKQAAGVRDRSLWINHKSSDCASPDDLPFDAF